MVFRLVPGDRINAHQFRACGRQRIARKAVNSRNRLCKTLCDYGILPIQALAREIFPGGGMDGTDRKLLSLLRHDARLPVAALAKSLGVSRGTVQNRLDRLAREGVILGYTVRLKPTAEERSVRALMTVAVEGNRTDEVLRALRGDPAVCALHTTNGRWDIVAELETENLEEVDRVLGRIRQIEGISSTETSLLLSTHKY